MTHKHNSCSKTAQINSAVVAKVLIKEYEFWCNPESSYLYFLRFSRIKSPLITCGKLIF